MEKQLVIFELASEQFGVDIAMVESIIKMQTITRVPHAPDYVEGITNLRGAVLPVIDLKKRLGILVSEYTRETRIMIVSMSGLKVGMIVDAVSEVLTIDDKIIEPIPAMVSTVDSAFVIGIAKIDDHLVILLDVGKILSSEERAATALI